MFSLSLSLSASSVSLCGQVEEMHFSVLWSSVLVMWFALAKEKKNKQKRKKKTQATVIDNFSKLMSDTKPQIQEAQRTSSKWIPKIPHLFILYLNCRKPRQRKFERNHRGKIFYLQRNKDKNYSMHLIRNHAHKRRAEKNI